jgi:hypothetical protein
VDNETPGPQPTCFGTVASDGGATLEGMSFLVPDPGEMYSVADRISAHAAVARQRAGELAGALGGTDWHGPAANVFDAMARAVLAGLRTGADRLDDAAAALRRHAAAVAAEIAAIQKFGSDAAHMGEDLGKTALDTVTDPGRLLHDAGSVVGDAGGLIADGAAVLGLG